MTGEIYQTSPHGGSSESLTLKFLDLHQVEMIDEALSSLDGFGEVRLILQKGKLRFVVTQQSHDALKWQPGHLANSED